MVKHRGDNICGVLLLDKPSERSSNFYLQRIKYLFNAKKAGHTGSLDPLATGLLPICFGKATCLSEYFLHSDKSYEAIIQFGVSTDSHDSDGDIVSVSDVEFSQHQFDQSLKKFIGDIEQTPPMVSALKHNGQPLYKLALKGQEIERKPRKMQVFSLAGVLLPDNQAKLTVHCSSGFYVRQLTADLGEELGCGAHIKQLRRISSKYLTIENAIKFDDIEAKVNQFNDNAINKQSYIQSILIEPDKLLKSLPAIEVGEQSANDVSHGRKANFNHSQLQKTFSKDQHYRLYQRIDANQRHFLGIAEINSEGLLKVRRLFNKVLNKV